VSDLTGGAPEQATAGMDASILEHSLGPKLDANLIANNQTLEEMEEELRIMMSVPENRSMAGPASHAYLALVLHRLGRVQEASAELQRFMSDDFSIKGNGAWVGESSAQYHMHDSPFSKALVEFYTSRGVQNVGDFGCGLGLYVRDLRDAGLRAGGFDGNPDTVEITAGRCQQLDLSRSVDFGVYWDWVMSLEVAEHIPPEFEDAFVANLVRHTCWGLVLSWGNQAGEGHVNVKPREQVEAKFAALGFRSLADAGEKLRRSARLPWFQNTVLVLERISPPAACRGSTGPGLASVA